MTIDPSISMGELVSRFPAAQRAMFQRYHIGGCQSCGFHAEETLAALCARNGGLPVAEVVETILTAQEAEAKMEVSPTEAAQLVKEGRAHIVDVRTREEWDAVHIEGSTLLTAEVQHELAAWPKEQLIIFLCHHGVRSLNAASYFLGHGIENVRSMSGGIDQWSCEVDPALPRYELA